MTAQTPRSKGPADLANAPAIGAYDVLFELGHGGMGAVYLARAVGAPAGFGGFERLVAIKRLHLHLTGQADSVERFLDEAKVAARIHHANVVGIHQVGSDAAGHFLVQDYVEGDTLQGLVDYATLKRERLPPPIVLRIALDALSGLHAVHEARDAAGAPLGILHRDVSAQNLLVGCDGVTRLADFGIAKHALSSVVTDGQYLQGRVLYMPPEYLAREPIDRRFDVYGMGITMFLALTGDTPWPGASDAQIVHRATSTGIPSLSSTGLKIAPPIEAIVSRACDKDPAVRYASARQMLEEIEDVGRHTGWIASHGEVAALVEQLAGRELAARRATIARSQGRAGQPVTPSPMSVPLGAPPDAGATDRPSSFRRVFPVVAGVGALVLGAAAVSLSLKSGSNAPAKSSAASGPGVPSTAGSASPSVKAPDVDVPALTLSVAATPTGSAAPTPTTSAFTPSPAPQGRAPTSRVAPLPPATPPHSPPLPTTPATTTATTTPSPINTANPYR